MFAVRAAVSRVSHWGRVIACRRLPSMSCSRLPRAGHCARVACVGIAAAVAILVVCSPAAAQDQCLGAPEPIVMAGAAGPSSLALADGRTVRLADVTVDPAAAMPLERYFGRRASLREVLPPGTTDRHGRILGEIVMEDTGAGVRAELLEDGLALVEPAVMHVACLADLFAAERQAETAGRGLWARSKVVLSSRASDLTVHTGRTVLVSGTVESIGETKRTIYLNFGADWRTDFTVLIRRSDAKTWGHDLTLLKGERVRLRGVLEAWNGGLIQVEHPAQIERLAAAVRVR